MTNVANGTSPATSAPIIPGYQLLEAIGRGSVGTVWRATAADGTEAAIKVMPFMPFFERAQLLAVVHSELAVYRAVPEAKIVPILGIGETAEAVWLAMTYFPHGTLGRLMARPDRDLRRLLRVLASLARTLAAVHEAGYFHGDLKPSNVLLDGNSEPYLLDFYFTAGRQRGRDVIMTTPLGTPLYMAPEQALGQPMSSRCDIYSLGVLAYEMLAGKLPYDPVPSNLNDMVKVISEGRSVPLHQANRRVPASVTGLVSRMLAVNPEERPASMQDVAKELTTLAEGGAGRAPAAPARPWWRFWG